MKKMLTNLAIIATIIGSFSGLGVMRYHAIMRTTEMYGPRVLDNLHQLELSIKNDDYVLAKKLLKERANIFWNMEFECGELYGLSLFADPEIKKALKIGNHLEEYVRLSE